MKGRLQEEDVGLRVESKATDRCEVLDLPSPGGILNVQSLVAKFRHANVGVQ